ncbi:MAG: DUF2231 domain-containing protein [Chryseolinea sp.]
MSNVAAFFGRLHPLLVHLPIGILFLAALFELLSFLGAYKKLRLAVRTVLLWGAITASAAVATGLVLAQEGGYDDRLLSQHRNAGIATAVFAWIIFFVRKRAIRFFDDKDIKKLVRVFLFVPLVGVLLLTGHFGGSLTHGEDYLFVLSEEPSKGIVPIVKVTSTTDLDSAELYRDIIEPILKSRCYECHGAKKQKGKLRLDQPALIIKGGKHGSALDGIVPDSTLIYRRLVLPLEDEHHMPPNEKPQLSSAEIALIQTWLAEGADFKMKIGDYNDSIKIKTFIHSITDKSAEELMVPGREVQPASEQSIKALTSLGVLVIPVGAGSNYLSVSFLNARRATDVDLKLLLAVMEQVVWLNLGRTAISDGSGEVLSRMTNLTWLNLEYTAIGDGTIAQLKPLSTLNTLNIVGTQVTDEGLLVLKEMKSMRKIFLYKTKVTRAGIIDLAQASPAVIADSGGYQLPVRVTDTLVFKYR